MARCPTCGASWPATLRFCPDDGARLAEDELDATVPAAEYRGPARLDPPEPGALLDGKYRLEDVIGRGGMGVVYRARHLRIGRTVAIKVLRSEVVGDAAQVARFAEEARLAGGIGHDGIVEILDLVTPHDGPPYIVMEHLDGESLRDHLTTHATLPPVRSIRIAVAVCEALGAAHRREIIHRDVKPGNIFLARKEGRGEVVKLLDFGIARMLRAGNRITSPGRAVGTAHYMPPEQIMGDGDVDHRVDLYAVCAVLFRMVAGQPPFEGQTWADIATKKVTEEAPRLSSALPVAPLLDEVVSRGLSKRPQDRHESADELAVALGEALRQARRQGGGTSTDVPTLQMRRKARIAVLPFSVETGDKEDAWLGQGLARAIADELMVRPGQRVVEPHLVAAALRGAAAPGPTSPTALGPELGAGSVVTGRLLPKGREVEVVVTVHDVETSDEVGVARVEGTRGRILALALSSLGSLEALGLGSGRGAAAPALAATDPDAFKQYLELSGRVHDAEDDPDAAAALVPEIDWALAVNDGDPGLRRIRAAALLASAALQPSRETLARAHEDLEALAALGHGDPWLAVGRAALRATDALFEPREAIVLVTEARVVSGPDPRLQLVEATALESLGRFDEASTALSMALDIARACTPALLRLATLDLSPSRVAEESLERAAYLIRGAHRLATEESVEGARASSSRGGWPTMPPLWPLDAILAIRQGDVDAASRAIDEADPRPPRQLAERLYALSARDFVASALGLRPRGRPGLLLGAMDAVRGLLAGPRSYVVLELAACVPEAWLPVFGAYLETHPEDLRVRLLKATLHCLDGDLDEALENATEVEAAAGRSPLGRIAKSLEARVRRTAGD